MDTAVDLPIARDLIVLLRASYSGIALLQAACDALERNPDAGYLPLFPKGYDPGPQPWPLSDAALCRRLLNLIGDALKRDPSQARGWACFRALCDGADFLANAAILEPRDGHEMRRPGGLRLSPAAFNGERLRAQVLTLPPSPGVPGGEVLRITWEDTGRLVVQSKPGLFWQADSTAEPE
ncbi:hypothetical protein [Paucibacter sp. Y2R2-4]|uniref:hypothetical protein n=1 Tax=Paucibacter sp. Y2R2-4 TaxID=2893553 RepID=UPI0021E4FC2A|nr:hypothetical protein [Paucibacter sp. Y2R2-4]MCV2348710.1 hypothetical protein [Paucibacter sp. Y2R2-4]